MSEILDLPLPMSFEGTKAHDELIGWFSGLTKATATK